MPYLKLRNIILVALALRIAFPVLIFGLNRDVNVFHDNDTIEYIEPARSLITSGQFVTKGVPEIERTPGYPLLLVPGILLGRIDLITIALQIVLGCISVLIVYKIGLLLFDTYEIGLLCAALYAVEPLTIMYTSQLYSETLYATVSFGFFVFSDQVSEERRAVRHHPVWRCFGRHGLCETHFLLYAFPDHSCAYPLDADEAIAQSQTILSCGLVLLISMAMIVVWQARNKIETGYSGFSAISDQNLYFYVGGAILAKKHGVRLSQQLENMGYGVPETYFSLHPEQRSWSRDEVYRYRGKEGLKLVLENPWTFFRLGAENAMTTLRETGATDLLDLVKMDQASPEGAKLKWILKLPLFIVLLAYWTLAAIGVLSKRWSNGAQLMVLILVAAYLVLTASMGGIGYSRFRHPVLPIVCLMAGCGLFTILERFAPLGKIEARVPARRNV